MLILNLKRLFSYLLFLLLIFFVMSCDESPSPSTKTIKKTSNYDQSFTPIPDSIAFEDITSTFMIYKIYSYHDEFGRYFTSTGADAAFYNSGDYSVSAGMVYLNNDLVNRYSTPTGEQEPDSMYSYTTQPYNAVSFNGSNYSWNITGSNDYSSFSFQMSAPDHEANISSPSNGANISINETLTVSWQTSLNQADKVKVSLYKINSGIEKYVDDTGSCTFSSNELMDLGTGNITLEVTVGNFKLVGVSGGKYALGLILSTHSINCNLTQ